MRVLVIHDQVPNGAAPDAADALVQADAIQAALADLGHDSTRTAVSLNLRRLADALAATRPDAVFNLVESLGGRGSLIHLAPTVVESLGVPCTGCPAWAVMSTSNKLAAKRMMRNSGIDTPSWLTPDEADKPAATTTPTAGRWIVKSVWEHASVGLDDDSVIDADDARTLIDQVNHRLTALGGQGFAEQFIDGREFNLSLLEQAGRPHVLPPAEIVFDGYGNDRPRVVGYRAKWDPSSYEFHHTPRRFDFPAHDHPLLTRLRRDALRCWDLFQLRGYARVDFRVDADGRPWVLEVNTNPCLSPDAGFMAAAGQAGLSATSVVESILAAALPATAPTGATT